MSTGDHTTYSLLPHEFPFIMIDEVYDIEVGKKGKGKKLIPVDDSLGRGDVFPNVLLIETAAQLSGIVSGRKQGGFFAGLRNISFHKGVRAGDTVHISSEMKGAFGGLYSFNVTASCEGEAVLEGELFLALA